MEAGVIDRLTLAVLEESYAVAQHRVLEHQQLFGEVFNECEEASLGVVPRVGAKLLVVRSQAVHDARYTELEVTAHTVHRPSHRRKQTFFFVFVTFINFNSLNIITLTNSQKKINV